jgi:hypothetical protein
MKGMTVGLVSLLIVVFTINSNAQTTLRTETSFQYDKFMNGVQVQRVQFNSPAIELKYDYKTKTGNGKPINDVFGISLPITVKDDFSVALGVIKLGDWNDDESFINLTAEKKFGAVSFSLELGKGAMAENPRDYITSRISHELFTVEAGILSEYGYSGIEEFTKDKYYWAAIHPEHAFFTIGNEISRTWMGAGTRNLEGFGSFTFFNADRDNKNFWFKSQFGFGKINQKFYCLDNYRVAMSYLIVPQFFYRHFSPISTKGEYALKIEGKRTMNAEKWEITGAKDIGCFGQVAIGWQRESEKSGVNLEYYKEVRLIGCAISGEFRYETIYNRFSGFITANYEF